MLNQSAAVIKPRRVAPKKMYLRLHYEDRIKPAVEEEWNKAVTERGEQAASGMDVDEARSARLKLTGEVTSKLWEEETEGFRDNVLQLREEDLEAQRERKRINESDPETAHDYQL